MHSLMNHLAVRANSMGSLSRRCGSLRAMILSGAGSQLAGVSALLAANLVGYLGLCLIAGWPYALGLGNGDGMQPHYDRYGVAPLSWVISGRPVWPGWLTSMFVHTGPWHLSVNAFWIWVFGRQYGWWAILVYLWGGGVALLVYVAVDPYSRVAVVGASASLSALAGGLIAGRRLPVSPLRVWRWRVPGNLLLGVFAGALAMQALELRFDALGLHVVGLLAGMGAGGLWVVVARNRDDSFNEGR